MIRWLAFALALFWTASATAEEDAKALGSFAELRAEILDAIGAASRRVWLVTDYLTDGEIVSALYLAQYRKLDVQVLLGRGKSNFYMSRLSYLKNQNIPVYLRPDAFKPGHPSALLADDRLLLVDGELDFLAKVRQYRTFQASPERRDAFHAAFASAANLRVPAIPQQVPLVGKAQGKGRVYSPAGAPGTVRSPGASGVLRSAGAARARDESGSDAYIYDRAAEPRPEDVPSTLPKAVKWSEQKRAPVTVPSLSPSAPESQPPALPLEGG